MEGKSILKLISSVGVWQFELQNFTNIINLVLFISPQQGFNYVTLCLRGFTCVPSCQTQEELAESLGVAQQGISKCVEAMGIIQKKGNWVPYQLKPRDVVWRFFDSEQLLQRQNRKGFLHRIVTSHSTKKDTTKLSSSMTMLGYMWQDRSRRTWKR